MRQRPQLSTRSDDTSTWGKRLIIRAGLNDSLVGAPFGPFTPSPDTNQVQRLADVRAPTAVPSVLSRDVVAYIIARQKYDNNPGITTALPQNSNPQAVTPIANREAAFECLFGRLTTSRGGVSSAEEFVIPAQGVARHIGSDTARLEVFFDPSRANVFDDGVPDGATRGKLAAGFEVIGGVATSGYYPDEIRQFYSIDIASAQTFPIPQFAQTLQVYTPTPQFVAMTWLEDTQVFGPLHQVPNSPVYATGYVDQPQPIPVNASALLVLATNNQLTSNPVLVWRRRT